MVVQSADLSPKLHKNTLNKVVIHSFNPCLTWIVLNHPYLYVRLSIGQSNYSGMFLFFHQLLLHY